jgi:class 3 adenylate cyclase
VAQLERLSRLKRFFSRPVAEAIVAGGEELLKPHRREITAVFLDLRGFTSFTDRADPDEVMDLLRDYHATLGRTVEEYGGTLEHFAGDGIMIFFSDPLPVDRPAERAVRMALALQDAFNPISEAWEKLGHQVGLGIGISQGEATLGVIGFEQRWEYAAIGNVPNIAARLCGHARAGEIILDAQTETAVAHMAETEPIGPLELRGFVHPVAAFRETTRSKPFGSGAAARQALKKRHARQLTKPMSASSAMRMRVRSASSMSAFPLARGGGEHEELEASEAPHQLAQGAGARAVRAELAMNCRQEREDRGELAR